MKKISLAPLTIAAVMILCLIVAPCTSVPVLYDETVSEYVSTSSQGELYHTSGSNTAGNWQCLRFTDITKHPDLTYIVIDIAGNQGYWTADSAYMTVGRHDFSYTFNGKTRPGVVYVERSTDALGAVTDTKFTIFLNDWDIGSLTGSQLLPMPFYIYKGTTCDTGVRTAQAVYPTGNVYPTGGPYPHQKMTVTVSSGILWKNHITIGDTDGGYVVAVNRTVDGAPYTSTLNTSLHGNVIHTSTLHGAAETLWYDKTAIDLVEIISPSGSKYPYSLTSPTPSATVNIYVKSSQTGAAIANSNIVIDALVNGEYHPVANKTEPSGIFCITLQPTGGGQPNPDGYRLIATADGYNNPMPEINFTVTDSKKYIYCYLDPIAGGPENENNTFIDFYVRDLSANPVSGATVKFGKYTLITNSHGYTVFEVPKNTDYTYTVSKSGYGPVTGNANIGANDRYIINAVIGPAVTQTTPTAIPTDTQTGPTPTLTAPTGEPVSNWLEWFAAHFGMILGGGVEIGKIFMWLCCTVPVGVYVGKEAKAGAAGFMAGAGIVTLFFVLIGWVPIWLLVLLALIIGLLYAKVFNSQDNGGGR